MESRSASRSRNTGLRGRARECALLDALIVAIRRGESRSLVLRGEAGIGKTALLDYLIASASEMTVVRAVGVESEMELPYAGLHQLFGTMLDRLERLPPPQRQALAVVFGLSAGAVPERFLVGLAALSLVSEAAEDRPLLCVVDDAQWLDQASALTLAFVARRLLAETAGIVFAEREAGNALAQLPALEVRGLQNGEARALLGSGVRFRLDERVRDQIVAETRGNPLALMELPRGLAAPELASGFGLLSAHALPGRIEDSFLRRLTPLSPDGRRLLLLAAADSVGDPLLLWRAAERLDIRPGAADEVEEQELLIIGSRVTFRHPLVRSAVYGSAGPQERRAVHLALALSTDQAADPDRRAWHLAAAAEGPDEEVAVELERSANRAQARGGLAAAAAFLQRAVALTGDHALRADRALAAADASVRAGTFDLARHQLAIAEAGPRDELQGARAELLLGQIAAFSSGADAPSLLLHAAQRLEPLDAKLARETYLDAWFAALRAGHLAIDASVVDISLAARSVPRPEGAPSTADLLLDSLSTVVADGRSAAAALLTEAALTFAGERHSAHASLRWGWLTLMPSWLIWDWDGAHAIVVRSLRALRDVGALAWLPATLSAFSMVAARCGDLASTAEAIAEAEEAAEATGIVLGPYAAATLAAYRGDEIAARGLIDTLIRQSAAHGAGLSVQYGNFLVAVLCNGRGQYREAMAAAHSACDEAPGLFLAPWATVELLEAAVKTEHLELANAAVQRVVDATSICHTDSALGVLARCRALVSEGETAEWFYEEAVARLGRSRLRPDLARAHLLYGEWLRRGGRRVDARAQLRAAHELFTSIGMEGFAERARNELLATGEKVRKRSVETRDDLSPQERQIAQLARDRLSNPEIAARLFLSPRTVEWHLRKVYTKLGIGSRRELVDALRVD
jgi:DNA-binding CsgD family transcriptional regulator